MKVIHKFSLHIGDTYIQVPPSAKAVKVEEQFGQLQVWIEYDPNELPSQRQFSVFGTGNNISDELTHIGTVLMEGGCFVAHVYELK